MTPSETGQKTAAPVQKKRAYNRRPRPAPLTPEERRGLAWQQIGSAIMGMDAAALQTLTDTGKVRWLVAIYELLSGINRGENDPAQVVRRRAVLNGGFAEAIRKVLDGDLPASVHFGPLFSEEKNPPQAATASGASPAKNVIRFPGA
jgi:hypothetical protein